MNRTAHGRRPILPGTRTHARALAVALVLAGALAAGCGDDGDVVATPPPGEAAPSALRLTLADAGRTVRLAREGTLRLELATDPATGYQWMFEHVDLSVLQQQGEDGFLGAPGDTVGGGGVSTWTFRTTGPGTTKLRLAYRRPWEEGVAPEKTFEVEVTVP